MTDNRFIDGAHDTPALPINSGTPGAASPDTGLPGAAPFTDNTQAVEAGPQSQLAPKADSRLREVEDGDSHASLPSPTPTGNEGAVALPKEGATDLAPAAGEDGEVVPAFDWDAETIFSYMDHDKNVWHQVGYRDMPNGRQFFERYNLDRGPLASAQWTDAMSGVMRIPYNVAEVNRRKVLLFVESERAADFLNRKLRTAKKSKLVTATTTAGGLGQAHNVNIEGYAFKKLIVVLPTNDAQGMRHANEVCRLCAPKAAHLRIVALPHRSPGGGIEDFWRGGGRINDLIRLVEEAEEWVPQSSSDPTQSNANVLPDENN